MLAAPWGRAHGGIIDLCAIFAVCTCRAGVTFRPLWPLLTTRACLALWASGTRSACGALRALCALRADRADGSSVALKVTACDAVLQLLQTASGFLSAFVCTARTGGGFISSGLCVFGGFQSILFGGNGVRKGIPSLLGRCPGLLCCRLCIGLGLLCGGGVSVHGIHQLLPCRGARFRLCAILCA